MYLPLIVHCRWGHPPWGGQWSSHYNCQLHARGRWCLHWCCPSSWGWGGQRSCSVKSTGRMWAQYAALADTQRAATCMQWPNLSCVSVYLPLIAHYSTCWGHPPWGGQWASHYNCHETVWVHYGKGHTRVDHRLWTFAMLHKHYQYSQLILYSLFNSMCAHCHTVLNNSFISIYSSLNCINTSLSYWIGLQLSMYWAFAY